LVARQSTSEQGLGEHCLPEFEFESAMSFLEESKSQQDARKLERERQRVTALRRTRVTAGVLGVALIVALGAGAYAVKESILANDEALMQGLRSRLPSRKRKKLRRQKRKRLSPANCREGQADAVKQQTPRKPLRCRRRPNWLSLKPQRPRQTRQAPRSGGETQLLAIGSGDA